MQTMTIDQIRATYPDQWILIGNPELKDPEINGSIVSKLLSGVVLFASKDKRALAQQAPTLRSRVDSTVCVYTGEIPKNRLFLL